MKKLYSLALAATVAVSASAASFNLRTDVKAPEKMHTLKMQKVAELDGTVINPLALENGVYTIDGLYEATIGDFYFGDNSVGMIETKLTITWADQNKGTITISEDSGENFVSDVTATYNAATKEITFQQIKLGSQKVGTTTYYVKYSPFIWDNDAEDIVQKSTFTVDFNETDGFIDFPADFGFGWGAYTTASYATQAGWFNLFDMIEASQYEEAEVEEIDEVQEGEWNVVGTATLEDAWITPAYTSGGVQYIPSENLIHAQLQQNVNNSNLYRLWRPYHDTQWALVGNNTSAFEGQIVFDITDPEHVVVKPGMPAGFKNQNGDFYVYGMLGWQIFCFGDKYDASLLPQIIAFMESKNQPFDTYADGVMTVNRSVFDIAAACTNAYTWTDNAYVVSKITFPALGGVDEIIDNVENGAVEYYNLQGIRVDNPTAGQLVIKKQGSKATKVLVK